MSESNNNTKASAFVNPKTAMEAENRKKEKRSNLLYVLIGVVFLVVAIASIIFKSGIIERNATAVVIDGQKYTAAEVNFYYQNAYNSFVSNYSSILSYTGLNTSMPLEDQVITEDFAEGLGTEAGTNWKDYFLDLAFYQMASVQNVLQIAKDEGYTFSDDVEAQVDLYMDSLEQSAKASGVSVSEYLQSGMGKLMTKNLYKTQLTRLMQFSDYTASYKEAMEYSDKDLEDAYAADTNSYDKVSYECVTISGAVEKKTDADGNTVEPTDAETTAALKVASITADQILASYQDGKSLKSLVSEDNDKLGYSSSDSATYAGDTVTSWLFDSARQPGDSAVLNFSTNYYVVVFKDRYRDETCTVNVRHILVPLGEATLAAEDDGYAEEQAKLAADANAEANAILNEWKNGNATEDSFAALANEKSTDPGSNTNGGLYTDVYPGQMVASFNDWCFASGRAAGDTGVVDTNYGSHVMYYVGSTNVPVWKMNVRNALVEADYNEWALALSENADIQRVAAGLANVG